MLNSYATLTGFITTFTTHSLRNMIESTMIASTLRSGNLFCYYPHSVQIHVSVCYYPYSVQIHVYGQR